MSMSFINREKIEKSLKRICVCASGLTVLPVLTGSTYDHLIGEEAEQNAIDLANGVTMQTDLNFRTWISQATLSVSDYTKLWAIPVIIGSIIIGIFLLLIFKNTAKVKKYAIFLFILGIPALMVLVTYGAAALASWFL